MVGSRLDVSGNPRGSHPNEKLNCKLDSNYNIREINSDFLQKTFVWHYEKLHK